MTIEDKFKEAGCKILWMKHEVRVSTPKGEFCVCGRKISWDYTEELENAYIELLKKGIINKMYEKEEYTKEN